MRQDKWKHERQGVIANARGCLFVDFIREGHVE